MKLYKEKFLNNLTICIFTLNRKFDLERLVEYLNTSGARVLILDASKEPTSLQNLPNLEYIHVPNMTLQARLIKFSELVKTSYILLSPDDDYWAIKGLNKTVRFLDTNLDYASAQGLRIRFFDFPLFYWIPDYVNQMNLKYTQINAMERLFEMATGMHYIYSVIRRTEFLKVTSCLNDVKSEKRNSLMMNELIFNYTLPILGKHRVLPVFYSARKSHNYEGSDINFRLWVDDNADEDAVKFRKNIVDFYRKNLNISQKESDSIFLDLTQKFTKPKPITKARLGSQRTILRNLVTNSSLRTLRKVSKPKYLYFYWLLLSNKNFTAFTLDVFRIGRHLKNHRIEQ